ncbi:MAG: glycerophosphodiester phosphodiesterase [Spirochaetes bacterium]|nr:glycerophosphodiester phosphodiesterase [Spirochaetota bacterium]
MFLIIGHRGASGYEPENTLLSFRKALDQNADMIEMDIFKCKTGELVVIHDSTVDRTTNGKGKIQDLTFNELRALDAGKGEKIPALDEVLNMLNGKVKINLELKGEDTAQPVCDLIREHVNERRWKYNDFYISSFNHRLLQKFISFIPKNAAINICPLIYGIPIDLAELKTTLNAYSINISADFNDPDIIEEAHTHGMKVFVYVVNTAEEALKLQSLGIDGVFTDYPDRLQNLL